MKPTPEQEKQWADTESAAELLRREGFDADVQRYFVSTPLENYASIVIKLEKPRDHVHKSRAAR